MSDVIIRDKTEYHTRTTDEMERHLSLRPWSLRQKMALACRILAAEGHESALAGQITTRGDRPGTYWMLSFGLGFDEARASNIVLVDDDLRLLEGNGMVNPSNRFHLWIYRHRPNVNAIVHTHPPHCSALSIVGKPLVAAHRDTAMFYDDCAYLPEWPGPPIGDEEGRIIHEALGDKRAILLAHHGQLVATSTIEEAAVLAVFIERAARMQLLAESIGTIKPIKPEIAREAPDYRLKPRALSPQLSITLRAECSSRNARCWSSRLRARIAAARHPDKPLFCAAERSVMSAFGTKRTSNCRLPMSAIGGKADIAVSGRHVSF